MDIGAMEAILPGEGAGAIDDAAEAGFDGLEIDVAGPDPGDDPVWTAAGRSRIRRRAAELDVRIPSICLGFLNEGGLTADDPDVRADARTAIRNGVDAAAAVGAGAVLVPFFGVATIESERHRERVTEGIGRVADDAAAAGITLAVENTLSGEDNRDLVERIDRSAVGVYYDIGNAIAYDNDPVEDIRVLGDDVSRVHIKDWGAEGSCPIGNGQVDLAGCVEALEVIGYDDWLVLETATTGDPIADARTNRERTENWFG